MDCPVKTSWKELPYPKTSPFILRHFVCEETVSLQLHGVSFFCVRVNQNTTYYMQFSFPSLSTECRETNIVAVFTSLTQYNLTDIGNFMLVISFLWYKRPRHKLRLYEIALSCLSIKQISLPEEYKQKVHRRTLLKNKA